MLQVICAKAQKSLADCNEERTQARLVEVESQLAACRQECNSAKAEAAQYKQRIDSLSDKLCSICEDRVATTRLPCQHKYCNKCILSWLQVKIQESKQASAEEIVVSCPMCRELHTASTLYGLI